MLNTIDTVIAFAVIMTVLSLLITIVVQMISAAFSLRGKNLANALALTFQTIDPKIGEHAHSLANQVLRDPIFSDSLWREKSRPSLDSAAQKFMDAQSELKDAHARKPEDFMRDQAITDAQAKVDEMQNKMAMPAVTPNRKAAWGFWSPPWIGSSALGSAIRPGEIYRMLHEISGMSEMEAALRDIPPELVQKAVDLIAALQRLDQPAIESQRKLLTISQVSKWFEPGQQPTILAALDNLGATVERATTQAYDRFQRWFGSAQDRAEQWFQMHVRMVTITCAILIAFFLQLDSVEMFQVLRVNPRLVDALIKSASGVVEVGKDVLDSSNTPAYKAYLIWKDRHRQFELQKPPASGTWQDYHQAITARLQSANVDPDQVTVLLNEFDDLKNDATKKFLQEKQESVLNLKKTLVNEDFNILPEKFLRRWEEPDKSWMELFWRHLFGVALTAGLLTLGAPFWFNMLKNLMNLRPAVASLIEKRPTSAPALPAAPEKASPS